MSTEPQRLPLLQSLYVRKTEDQGRFLPFSHPPLSQEPPRLAHAPNLLKGGQLWDGPVCLIRGLCLSYAEQFPEVETPSPGENQPIKQLLFVVSDPGKPCSRAQTTSQTAGCSVSESATGSALRTETVNQRKTGNSESALHQHAELCDEQPATSQSGAGTPRSASRVPSPPRARAQTCGPAPAAGQGCSQGALGRC